MFKQTLQTLYNNNFTNTQKLYNDFTQTLHVCKNLSINRYIYVKMTLQKLYRDFTVTVQ